ncbi:WxL domain-containing protein [Enterococcus hirae]|uniref:WxL domain-containing protein n=1 Tax=Enterococcus hirae TaxID=1354 RepID=UPI001A96001F|nr:WxL domain-containing protein [Enterococcus hirae]MBO1103560.1 WxL domain-containing protein [Enterococcus hirae]
MKLVRLLAVTALSGGALLGGSGVFAAENPSPVTTNGTVSYIPADDTNDETKDPEPETPGGEVTVPPTQTGSFAVAYAPDFDFGQHEITTKDATYEAKALEFDLVSGSGKGARAHFAQVRDLRGDSTKGWDLKVAQTSDFVNASSTLTGAQINLSNATSDNGTSTNSNVVINSNAQSVLRASNGNGKGLSSVLWGTADDLVDKDNQKVNPSVTLDVPGSSEKKQGTYSAELTWTLESVPS